MTVLSVDDIVAVHDAVRALFARGDDPIHLGGPRDIGFVHAAANRPFTSLDSTYKYPSPREKAAALFHSLVAGHVFHDGNKRTGVACLVLMLHRNGWYVTATDNEVFTMVIGVADHRPPYDGSTDDVVREVTSWIRAHTVQRRQKGGEMKRADFFRLIEAAGGSVRPTPDGTSWFLLGHAGQRIRLGNATKRLERIVVSVYLSRLGLGESATGLTAQELLLESPDEQALLIQMREVLERLAAFDRGSA